MAESFEPSSAVMEGETEGVDAATIASAEQLNQDVLAQAAAARVTIASIGNGERSLICKTLDTAIKEGRVAEQDRRSVEGQLQRLQAERMTEVGGDASVRVENMDAGTLGYFDGEGIALSVDGGIEKPIYKHELDHKEKGMPSHDLDANLAPETGIAAVDAQLEDMGPVNIRDQMEKSATDAEQAAGGEGSPQYLRTHVATANALVKEGREVGVDMEAAAEELIETHDVKAYQKALARVAVHKALREEGEGEEQKLEVLAEIAKDAREDHVHKETRETVADAAEKEFALVA